MLSFIAGYLFPRQREQKRTKNRDETIWCSLLGESFIAFSTTLMLVSESGS